MTTKIKTQSTYRQAMTWRDIPEPATPREDRVMGTVVAMATGDALGAPYEFRLPPRRGRARYGRGTFGTEPGEWTDDTSMAICILQARSDPHSTALGFRRWYRQGPKDVGNQTRQILSHCRSAATMPEVARAYARWLDRRPRPAHFDAGHANGSIMRCGPGCLPYLGDREKVAEVARELSDLTHYDPWAGDAAVLWSLAIEAAIGAGPLFRPAAIGAGLEYIPQERRQFWAGVISEALTAKTRRQLSRNGSAVGAFRAALYAVAHGRDLEDTLQLACSLGGDTDTTAAIAGSLAGAIYGMSAIPARLVTPLHGWPGLDAADLAELALRAAEDIPLRTVKRKPGMLL